MKKTLLISIIATLVSILSVNAGGFSWGVSIGIGHPVVYTTPVVYVPQPVVYAQPVVVYVQQPVVYAAPVGVIWVGGHHHGGGHYRGRR